MSLSSFFRSPPLVFTASILLRLAFLLYGLWQDNNSPIKYTDIDYYVFTDAARFLSRGLSPYDRDTYRYTPLLAWLIYPTVWPGRFWFSFGKVLFAVGDVGAGWMMYWVLKRYRGMKTERALRFAAIWLLNPMVATISTRGSSEGLLGVFVTALLWAALARRVVVAGMLLGFVVHFKIYPFIYAASIVWWLDESSRTKREKNQEKGAKPKPKTTPLTTQVKNFLNPQRLILALSSLLTFAALNIAMYTLYGYPFLQHSYFYHLTRIDHRHNFSPYNTLLYLHSSPHSDPSTPPSPWTNIERLAFLPQLLLSSVFIPLALAKKDLPATMLAQTFAFVTFNKVCTSQYFLWYLIFLPYHLPNSILLRRPRIGLFALALWILGQAAWLHQGFQLEFNGQATFVPGLFAAGLVFFAVNVGVLGVLGWDVMGLDEEGGVGE